MYEYKSYKGNLRSYTKSDYMCHKEMSGISSKCCMTEL